MCNKLSKRSICDECLNSMQNNKNTEKIVKFNKLKIKLNSKIYFDEQIYFYNYQDTIRKKIIEYKFGDKPYLHKMFFEMIFDEKLITFCRNYNLIIPVPIDKKRMKERGYNQTELIAKDITKKLLGIQIQTNILYKMKIINPQSTMKSKKERIQNIIGVFKVKNSEILKGKSVIVFDDIFTTGSTANECAKVLKQAGVSKIGIMTIAKD